MELGPAFEFEKLDPDLKWQVLIRVHYPDLLNLCQTSSGVKSICDTDFFWELKTQRDFGAKELTRTKSWKEEYRALYDSILVEEKIMEERLGEELLEEELHARSAANLKKVAKTLKVSTKGRKEALIQRLLEEAPARELLDEVANYPYLKGY